MAMKIALVVGACSGLGYSSVLSLAKSGVHIIGTYSTPRECPADVAREIEWLGVRAVMLQMDPRQLDLGVLAQQISETLRQTFFTDKLDSIIINTGAAFEPSARTVKMDQLQFYVMHVRFPYLLTETMHDLLSDACDVILISSYTQSRLCTRPTPHLKAGLARNASYRRDNFEVPRLG
jgi:NAD(P)-dependent dehydrogenase (short-subunit alcohol dehydrogenase family)